MLSRVADSLYWLSRYVERAENTARMLDVNLQLTLDSDHSAQGSERLDWQPILATLEDLTVFTDHYPAITAETVCDFVTFSRANPNSIWSCVAAARENARTVREYISSEMWEQLNRLWLWLDSAADQDRAGALNIDFYRHVVDCSHQFQGTTDATLTHADGWEFIHFGKFLERADNSSRILDLKYHILLPKGERVGGDVDTIQWQAVLKSCSAFEAYRKVYTGQVTPARVAEFIILHDHFPRSIRFCIDALTTSLHRISGCDRTHFSNEAERLAGRLTSDLYYTTINEIFRIGLHEYLDRTQGRLIEIGAAMRDTYCNWREDSLNSLNPSQGATGSHQSQSMGTRAQRQTIA
ncbi:MAG: alpha-E domain-containing protein [Chthoniobacteraceae bacterium]